MRRSRCIRAKSEGDLVVAVELALRPVKRLGHCSSFAKKSANRYGGALVLARSAPAEPRVVRESLRRKRLPVICHNPGHSVLGSIRVGPVCTERTNDLPIGSSGPVLAGRHLCEGNCRHNMARHGQRRRKSWLPRFSDCPRGLCLALLYGNTAQMYGESEHMNSLAGLICSQVRAEIFGVLFGVKAGALHLREIQRQTGFAIGTVRQDIGKLVNLGLVKSRRDGNGLFRRQRTASAIP
jgi:hypothetical protein